MNFGPYPEKRELPSFVQKQSGEELALKLLRQHDALDALHRKELSDVQKQADRLALERGMAAFERKSSAIKEIKDVSGWLSGRIYESIEPDQTLMQADNRLDAARALKRQVGPLPPERFPIIIAGGSFNNSTHQTQMRPEGKALIDRLLETADPEKTVFVIGHRVTGYEAYLVARNRGRFPVYAIVPTMLSGPEAMRLRKSGAIVSISIESSGLGLYKSFAYEIFKHMPSLLLSFDGNAAAANLIQEAKNGRYKSSIFVESRSRDLFRKAQTLHGYVRFMNDTDAVLRCVPGKE